MGTYTFYPCNADGVGLSLVACDLSSDAEARLRATQLLDEYASAAYVEAWQGERLAFSLRRPRADTAAGPAEARPQL
jgi:hypothetical protein